MIGNKMIDFPRNQEQPKTYEELLKQLIAIAEVLPIDKSQLNPALKPEVVEEALEKYHGIKSEPAEEHIRTLVEYAAYLFYPFGDEEKCLKAYAMALKIDGNEPIAHHHLGRLLMNNRSYENAIQLFERGLKLNSGSWLHREFHFDIHDLNLRLNHLEAAYHLLKKRLNDTQFRHYQIGKLETIEGEPHTEKNCPYKKIE